MAILLTETGDDLNVEEGGDIVTENHGRQTNFAGLFAGDDWPQVVYFAESGFEDY